MKTVGYIIGILIILLAAAFIFLKIYFPMNLYDIVDEKAQKYDFDTNFVMAVIKTESNFRKNVISKKGAVGLMQILPSTAKWICEKNRVRYKEEKLFETDFNIEVGLMYMKYLSGKYDNDITKTLAAYNAGSGRVKNGKWKEIKETNNYIKKIKIYIIIYEILERINNKQGVNQ